MVKRVFVWECLSLRGRQTKIDKPGEGETCRAHVSSQTTSFPRARHLPRFLANRLFHGESGTRRALRGLCQVIAVPFLHFFHSCTCDFCGFLPAPNPSVHLPLAPPGCFTLVLLSTYTTTGIPVLWRTNYEATIAGSRSHGFHDSNKFRTALYTLWTEIPEFHGKQLRTRSDSHDDDQLLNERRHFCAYIKVDRLQSCCRRFRGSCGSKGPHL